MSSYRNRLLKTLVSRYKIVSIEDSTAGDCCLYDKINDQIIIVNGRFRKKDFPSDIYTPVGLVIIPGNHAIYGDDTCVIMSLTEMSCTTPQTGSLLSETMCFSPQTDLSIPNYNVVIIKDSDTLKTNGFGYLSKNGEYAATTLKIPDPYNLDMSRNPDYYNTTVSKFNAMSDFDGRENNNIVLGIRGVKNYSTWKPTYNTGSHYPATSCCDMFYTEGTAQGEWYLPTAGEWGYITSKWNKFQKSIKMLNKNYGNIAAPLIDNASYWTCTEHNAKNNRYVHTNNGMGHTTKTTAMHIRAVTILKDEHIEFPLYLYTESLGGDFYRRDADDTSLELIFWYNKNCIDNPNGGTYIPSDVLSGKIFIDDYEVTSLSLQPSISNEFLLFETNYDYGLGEPMKVIQYHQTTSVEKGTIDIM